MAKIPPQRTVPFFPRKESGRKAWVAKDRNVSEKGPAERLKAAAAASSAALSLARAFSVRRRGLYVLCSSREEREGPVPRVHGVLGIAACGRIRTGRGPGSGAALSGKRDEHNGRSCVESPSNPAPEGDPLRVSCNEPGQESFPRSL